MKFIHLIISLLIVATLNSCKKENSQSTKQNKPKKSKTEKSIFENYTEMSIPYIDSTNFDNFDFKKPSLTKTELENLKLISIFSNFNYSKEAKFFIKHRIIFSEKYNSIVAICASENEMCTILINYDNQFRIIDFKEIAYDEIAESCLQTISEITKKKLQITESDYCNDSVTKQFFEFESNGKIKASH